MKKIKVKSNVLIKAVVAIGVVVVVALLLYRSGNIFNLRGYNVSMATSQKFDLMKKWLPVESDFIAIADIKRLGAMPSLARFFEDKFFRGDDLIVKSIRALINPEKMIGMIAMSITFDSVSGAPSFAVIVQGNLDKNLLDLISQELVKENAKLTFTALGEVKIYWQDGAEMPFAFTLPDSNHLIVGTKPYVESIAGGMQNDKNFQFKTVDSAFFGRVRSSERIKQILPPQVALLEEAVFYTDNAGKIRISIVLPDVEQANNLQAFLQGMKALYMLQLQENVAVQDVINEIVITIEGNTVIVEAPIEHLFSMASYGKLDK